MSDINITCGCGWSISLTEGDSVQRGWMAAEHERHIAACSIETVRLLTAALDEASTEIEVLKAGSPAMYLNPGPGRRYVITDDKVTLEDDSVIGATIDD